jgi:trimethylamine:corrinoid methyltransferase-like protein
VVSCRNILDAAAYGIANRDDSLSYVWAQVACPILRVAASCCLRETLSGIVLTQLVNPGTTCFYGSSAMYFDMKNTNTLLSSIEQILIGAPYAQWAQYHTESWVLTYAALSDSKF